MVDVNRLKGAIVTNGLNVTTLASKIGLDKATLYRKLADDGAPITIREADEITKALGLGPDEAMKIFFAQYVA